MPIYQASPEQLGTFDLVFCGSVMIHLRDPMLALERLMISATISSSARRPFAVER